MVYEAVFFLLLLGKIHFPPNTNKDNTDAKQTPSLNSFIYLVEALLKSVSSIYIYSSAAICQHFHEIPVKLLQLVFWTIINSDCFSFSLCFNKLSMFYVSFHFKGVFYVFFQKIFRLLDWIGLNLVEEKNE